MPRSGCRESSSTRPRPGTAYVEVPVESCQQNPQIRIAQSFTRVVTGKGTPVIWYCNVFCRTMASESRNAFLSNGKRSARTVGGRTERSATVDFNYLNATAPQSADQAGNHGRDLLPHLNVGVAQFGIYFLTGFVVERITIRLLGQRHHDRTANQGLGSSRAATRRKAD